MKDVSYDWCFEGGCTYIADEGATLPDELDTKELEAMYKEPCIARAD